ncbi:hypothetical protein OHB35_00695 [Streptomyces phaeochromogenes]|uniref:Uncharacterized protein n=1 Tax=Streptomyces phaeochromogenes TaxID=1923 RepID=A0ABZ1H0A4_STRPH|nr:hypothetical protein [Streptomyces phaeochromogenes]WSD11850.1 hypothetical protein OHB35_00695 [Streptomyces phaeochromogenes]
MAYGVRVADARVADARRDGDGFSVVTDDGEQVRARRVLMTDELPDVPGLAERWGHDVLHCVYCHGWEVRDTAIGVLGSFHQALLFRQMSHDVTLFRHTGTELSDEQWEQLAGLGVAVADGEVTGLHIDNEDRLAGVRLASGNLVPVRNLVVAPQFVARAGFLGGLGLSVVEHPSGTGEQVRVDLRQPEEVCSPIEGPIPLPIRLPIRLPARPEAPSRSLVAGPRLLGSAGALRNSRGQETIRPGGQASAQRRNPAVPAVCTSFVAIPRHMRCPLNPCSLHLNQGVRVRRRGLMVLTINVAVLLAVIIVVRLRRRVQARKRSDEQLTVLIVLVFGVLVAPTAFGQGIADVVGQLANGITNSGR